VVTGSSGLSRPNADRGDQTETGGVALMLALTTPKTVFVVIASEVAALELDSAALADSLCCLFAKFTCLRAFCRGGEEKVSEALACAIIHPRVVG